MTHPLLEHARRVVQSHLNGQNWRRDWTGEFTRPSRGCFVSLKVNGRLRGCIGTILPVQKTLEEEIADNAVAAATRDHRFPALKPAELLDTRFSIDLLTPPEPAASKEDLDPKRYGLIVQADQRCGVLLPDIPGIDSVERQLEICLEKAGIAQGEIVAMSRFQVERIPEEGPPSRKRMVI